MNPQIDKLPSYEELEATRIKSVTESEDLLRRTCDVVKYFGEPFEIRGYVNGNFRMMDRGGFRFIYLEYTTKYNVEQGKPDTTIFVQVLDEDKNHLARRAWRDPEPNIIDPDDIIVLGEWSRMVEDLYAKMSKEQEQQTSDEDIERRLDLARRLQITGGE